MYAPPDRGDDAPSALAGERDDLSGEQGGSAKGSPPVTATATLPANHPTVETSGPKGMLYAVSTLLALTPPGRVDELERLTALAHGFIGMADEEALVTLAKAVATRDDLQVGLADRLARSSDRAAQTLIRACALSDEAVAALIERKNTELLELLVLHHPLQPEHITMMIATGERTVIEALLDQRPDHLEIGGRGSTDVTEDGQTDWSEADLFAPVEEDRAHYPSTLVEGGDLFQDVADLPAHDIVREGAPDLLGAYTPPIIIEGPEPADQPYPIPIPAPQSAPHSSPMAEARSYAKLDKAGREAILTRLNSDCPPTTMADARRALDPTRNQADLSFLTIIERREAEPLAQQFSETLELPTDLVRKLLDEADGDALMVLARAAGLSTTAFARMVILSKVGLTGSPRDTFALVDRFKALPESTALYIVTAMRDGQLVEAAQTMPSGRRELLVGARGESHLETNASRLDDTAEPFSRTG
ncbi:MAG: hypothetical protein AAF739_07600 [Pseudomonadota bacterium]